MIFFQFRAIEIIDIRRQLMESFTILIESEVINGNPVSKSFFIYLVVAKERIKHSQARKFCLLCE
jgi:hypothetical protein